MTNEQLKIIRKVRRERALARNQFVATPKARVWGGKPDSPKSRRLAKQALRMI